MDNSPTVTKPPDELANEDLRGAYDLIRGCDDPVARRVVLVKFELVIHEYLLEGRFSRAELRPFVELWEDAMPDSSVNDIPPTLYTAIGRHDIRLLTFIENNSDNMVCRLDTCPHWRAPEYDALSYCWGESTEITFINCNGMNIAIRTSLYTALKHILEGAAYPLRPLWVDAICLNQDDENEKAHQVPRMGQIYRMATRTIIWLGPAADDSDLALEFLRTVNLYQQNGDSQMAEVALKFLDSLDGRPLVDALRAIMRRSWFSRLWVLQEAILSEFRLVLCGEMCLDWATLVTSFQLVSKTELSHLFFEFSQNGRFIIGRHPAIVIDSLESTRSDARANAHAVPFSGMLTSCEGKECREPVDRIWAVSGLFDKDLQQRIKSAGIIDYSPTGRSEYWRSYVKFMTLLSSHDPIDFWNTMAYCQGFAKHSCLPSWCPDFNATRYYHDFSHKTFRAGFPSAGFSTETKTSVLPETILPAVTGLTFDTVRSVAQVAGPGSGEGDVALERKKWFRESLSLAYEVLGQSQYAAGMLYETLGAESPGQARESEKVEERNAFIHDISRAYSDRSYESESLEEFCGGVIFYTNGRKFFNTSQGRIGLGPPDITTGDLVCIIYDAQPIVILRAADMEALQSSGVHSKKELEGQSELFHLIGDAYVHGCMNGEVFTATGRGPDRTFVLA